MEIFILIQMKKFFCTPEGTKTRRRHADVKYTETLIAKGNDFESAMTKLYFVRRSEIASTDVYHLYSSQLLKTFLVDTSTQENGFYNLAIVF
jgi:hypothetical protein